MESLRSNIINQIVRLEAELKSHKAALEAYDKHALDKMSGPEVRYYQMRPLSAIQQVLREEGQPLTFQELSKRLEAGGAHKGKKRGPHNIRISAEMSISTGKLVHIRDNKILIPVEDVTPQILPTDELALPGTDTSS